MALTALARPLTMRSTDATWTAADWEQLSDDGNRYEIIDGVLYMSTAPSMFHQWIIWQIGKVFDRQLVETEIAYFFLAPVGVFIPGCDPVQPDITVMRRDDAGILQDKRIRGIPALLVEVLSPSNAEVDLQTKLAAYARAGLPEYWVVRPATRDVLVCSEPVTMAGRYQITTHVAPDDELVSPTLPVRTRVADFFAGAPNTML